jgi:hypothetical protein
MRKKSTADSQLNTEIERLLRELPKLHDNAEEYDRIMARLGELTKIQTTARSARVSADTWALIGANLIGIVLIMGHEYTHPITTKALNLAIKPR